MRSLAGSTGSSLRGGCDCSGTPRRLLLGASRDGDSRACITASTSSVPGLRRRKGRWLAAVLGAGEGALLSRTCAAALHEIAKPRGSRIDVLVPAHRRAAQLKGVRVHRCRRIHPDDISLVDSIPVTSVERTICDLATVLPYADLKRAFEQAERRQLIDHRKLREAVERMSGSPGAATMRQLLGYDPRPATETRSELEIAFLELVTDAGLPPYQRNVSVHG